MRKLFISLFALIASCLIAVGATSAVTGINTFIPGFRTINGSHLNKIVTVINRLQGVGTTPVLTSCGTTPTITGSASAGLVTMGTGSPTGCVITFPSASYATTAPFCTVTWQTNIASMQYTVTTTALTLVQTATSSNLVNYRCLASTTTQ